MMGKQVDGRAAAAGHPATALSHPGQEQWLSCTVLTQCSWTSFLQEGQRSSGACSRRAESGHRLTHAALTWATRTSASSTTSTLQGPARPRSAACLRNSCRSRAAPRLVVWPACLRRRNFAPRLVGLAPLPRCCSEQAAVD